MIVWILIQQIFDSMPSMGEVRAWPCNSLWQVQCYGCDVTSGLKVLIVFTWHVPACHFHGNMPRVDAGSRMQRPKEQD